MDVPANKDIPAHVVTQLLEDWRSGRKDAVNELMPLVYEQLHGLARQRLRAETPGQTIGATALIHEAYLRLAKADISFEHRVHFYAFCSRLMRRILIDHARANHTGKRGGGAVRIPLDEGIAISADQLGNLIEIDGALERLAVFDPRKARIVEMIFFGGMQQEDAASIMHISRTTLRTELRLAKAWLYHELRQTAEVPNSSRETV